MAKKFTEDQLNWILSVNSTEAQQGIRQLTKANRELEKANKDRRQEMYKLEMQGKTETESYRRLTAVVKQNDIQIKSNRSLMKGLEDTLGLTSLTMSQLKKRAQDLQRQMDNTSKSLHPAEYNKLQTELVKVKNSMDDLKNAGKKTEETLGKTILSKGAAASLLGNIYTKAIEKLGQMVLKAKEFVSEGIKMAGMAQGIERAFNRISNPDTLSDLQKATKGSVNNLELMKAAVRASNFKIPLTELSTLLRFAQQRAQETGESVEYLTESIVTGIGRKSPLILDNLGISAVRLNEEISKTGDFTKAVGNIVREELSKSGESIDTAADRAQQRAALLQNIQMSIGQRMIEIVESSGSVWNSFLNVINKWVSIPTVEKIRDEQKEMNILARSIMAAEERTESRKLIIQEMQRQYPAFLANLDTEKLTNEQLSTRLQEVNKEYQNRIRVQVLNDKMLTPLREKQNELINKEQEGIIALSKYAELSGKYMSLSFRQSITSGNVLKMTQEEINKELETMEKRGAAKGLTLGINKTIKNLKQLPAEIQKVGDDINKTIDTIGSFGKNEDSPAQNPEPDKDLIEIEENKLKIAKEKKVTTKEALLLKNQEIAAIEKEIETLRYYGIEKEKIPPKNNPEKMVNPVENMRKSDTDKLNMLRNSYDVELSVIASGEKQKQSVIEQAFVSGKITRQQYDMLKLSLDVANAEDRLKIEQEYLQDVTDIELEIGEGKYQAIQNAGKRVLEADLKAHEARIAQQKSIQKAVTAVSDFKQQFNALAPEEETKLKLKALKAGYDAAQELAKGNSTELSELDAAYEKAKTNILQQEEDKRNQIRQQYGLLSMKDQHELEMEELQRQYDQGFVGEEEYQKAKNTIKTNYLKKSYDTYAGMFSGAITALQDAELANIDAKYDAEIQRAGDNTEEVERLEKEKENKKLAVQKKYAGVQFAIKVSEIIANTAVSIMQAFAQLGPIGGAIAAAMLGATGVAQIAIANSERKKVMNMSAEAGSSSGSGTGSRVVTGKQSGGYVDVIREQDGKEFNAEFDPGKRGFINKPTVIVGEGPAGNSKEWVASNAALENPTVAPFINVLNEFQEKGEIRTVDMNQIMRKRLAGFESGGPVSKKEPADSSTTVFPSTNSVAKTDTIKRLNDTLQKLDQKLDGNGLRAYVVYSDIETAQKILDKSKKIGGK